MINSIGKYTFVIMKSFFKLDKTTNAILYILKTVGGRCDLHKIFKMLYFADQNHLVRYGSPITWDIYVAMKNGPVPSISYDILKSLRPLDSSIYLTASKKYQELFELRDNYIILLKRDPNMDELSESEVECLSIAISENKDLSFGALSEKTHKSAWNKASENDNVMNLIDIAVEAGASKEMLAYINLVINNKSLMIKNETRGFFSGEPKSGSGS